MYTVLMYALYIYIVARYSYWSVVSTHPKNISRLGSSSQIAWTTGTCLKPPTRSDIPQYTMVMES